MRDIFEDIFAYQPLDPMEAARRNTRPILRKRFYASATAGEGEESLHRIELDGRPVRTPARHWLAAPTSALAVDIALEWSAQTEFVDPASMPLTRLANTIIDGVVSAREEVAMEIAKYLASDLVCYRAERPSGLVARQSEHWDPIVDWARDELSARFIRTTGIMHVPQPENAIAAAARAIPRDPWRLGAVSAITTLTGSALIALALAGEAITAQAAWTAAHVDEDWNIEAWGRDELAASRRAFRQAEMMAAATVLSRTS